MTIVEDYVKRDPPDNLRKLLLLIVEYSLVPYQENAHEILEFAELGAERRSKLSGREVDLAVDVPHVLKLYCWWPFKPKLNSRVREALIRGRIELLSKYRGRLASAAGSIPRQLLEIDPAELDSRLGKFSIHDLGGLFP